MSVDGSGWDRDALRYDEHWQPVLDASTRRLIERIGPLLDREPDQPSILDLGTGTGALLVAAARRWPGARLTGLDASAQMIARAVERVTAAGLPGDAPAVRWLTADAASMPLPDASVSLVMSSFVLQLVDDRRRVLDEVRRILRPGAWLAFVTWMAEDLELAADREFDEAVIDLDIAEEERESPSQGAGDFESVEQARAELADAGFTAIDVRGDMLVHGWTRESFLVFKREWDERELFESLGRTQRDHLVTRVRERWSTLPDDAFVLRAPLVSALARRP